MMDFSEMDICQKCGGALGTHSELCIENAKLRAERDKYRYELDATNDKAGYEVTKLRAELEQAHEEIKSLKAVVEDFTQAYMEG
jgi:hypothetical protein